MARAKQKKPIQTQPARSADELLAALARCRSAQIVIHGARPAAAWTTDIYSAAGHTRHVQSSPAKPVSGRVYLRGKNAVHVRYRTRKGERLEDLIWRALWELRRRERFGMPAPSKRAQERRLHRKLLRQADETRPQ